MNDYAELRARAETLLAGPPVRTQGALDKLRSAFGEVADAVQAHAGAHLHLPRDRKPSGYREVYDALKDLERRLVERAKAIGAFVDAGKQLDAEIARRERQAYLDAHPEEARAELERLLRGAS